MKPLRFEAQSLGAQSLEAQSLEAGALGVESLEAGSSKAASLEVGSLEAGAVAPPSSGVERRIVAIVLPDLLDELALRRSIQGAISRDHRGNGALPALEPLASQTPPAKRRRPPLRGDARAVPRAIVLSDVPRSMLEPTTRLDAVNAAARRLGVSPRHSIAQATAIVENLQLHALPPACVSQALQHVAETALGFGSPVAFRAPDTVWVDISGTLQLFGGEHELVLALGAHVRALGHSARVAVAPGPWLAQSFARHADFDETGILRVAASEVEARSGHLPIRALPLADDIVAWFARLGLLSLNDLRKLPAAALGARMEARGFERTLDLLRGRDDTPLTAHVPEELPFEEQSWDYPLDNVEPLLFIIKGLCARLGSRLEGRGQAARELLLSVRYDPGIVALRAREGVLPPAERHSPTAPVGPLDSLQIPFRLASPLAHADDLERIVRSRLGRQTLFAPALGLRLQVTAITEANEWQQSLNIDGGLGVTLSSDPRSLAVLVSELSADIGSGAVGRLAAHGSHLLEKSSEFVPIHRLEADGRGRDVNRSRAAAAPFEVRLAGASAHGDTPAPEGLPQLDAGTTRLPTRLLSPIEFKAPLKEKEIVVLERRAFVIESIRFEERIEAVEWWAASPVSRDYFRLWLASLLVPNQGFGTSHAANAPGASTVTPFLPAPRFPSAQSSPARSDGLEVLVFRNRDDGKKYVQALYD